MKKFLLCLLTSSVATGVYARWGGGSCSGQSYSLSAFSPSTYRPTAQSTAQAGYVWTSFKDDNTQLALSKDGIHIGNFHINGEKAGKFYFYKDGKWTEGTAPLIPSEYKTPEKKEPQSTQVPIENHGVDTSKIRSAPSNSVNGKPCNKKEAIEAIEGSVPDDGKKLRLTLIGYKANCDQVLKDLDQSSEWNKYKDLWLVQEYRPNEWAVQCGFKTDGDLNIYMQDSTGKVLHRQSEYKGVGQLVEAIRKADPTYDAAKDPDVTKPAPLPLLGPLNGILGSNPLLILLIGGGLLFLFLKKDK